MNPSPRSEAETETRGVNKFVASGVDPRFLLTPKRNDSGNTLSLAPAPSPLQTSSLSESSEGDFTLVHTMEEILEESEI